MGEYKNVVVVNEHDEVIGALPLFEAIAQKAYRRSVRIFVENAAGQLLLQRRGAAVIAPLLLDVSAAGHVDEGESYEEAAVRELAEELNLSGIPLQEIVISYHSQQFFSAVYKVALSEADTIVPNQEEIASIHWYSPTEIDAAVANTPEDFTIQFVELWLHIRDKIVAS